VGGGGVGVAVGVGGGGVGVAVGVGGGGVGVAVGVGGGGVGVAVGVGVGVVETGPIVIRPSVCLGAIALRSESIKRKLSGSTRHIKGVMSPGVLLTLSILIL
jgi:hypothetical protein